MRDLWEAGPLLLPSPAGSLDPAGGAPARDPAGADRPFPDPGAITSVMLSFPRGSGLY